MRSVHGVLAGSAIGAAFGAATSLINNVPGMLGEVGRPRNEQSVTTWIAEFASLILDSPWAWAALAVGIGWLVGSHARSAKAARIGALAGAIALIAATLAYYYADLQFGVEPYSETIRFWLVGSVVFGVPLGAAGSCIRRPGLVGLLAGLIVPVGAALNMVMFPLWPGLPGDSPAASWAQLSVWLAAAVGAALAAGRYIRTQRLDRRTEPVAR